MGGEKGLSMMVNKLLAAFLVVASALPLVSEAEGGWFMEKFDWLPSESAINKYPMTLVQGDLVLRDGSYLYVPSKDVIHNGWGKIGSTHVVGANEKALPVKLSAKWFSYAENKFFAGEFTLPYDKILELFKRGFVSPRDGKKTTFDYIIFGIGPEGAVSVWVAAEGIVLEVAKYRGTEVDIPWTAVTENEEIPRSQYVREVLEETLKPHELLELKEKGVVPGISDLYSKQYKWDLSVTGQSNHTAWLDTSNGESEYFDFVHPRKTRATRALPQSMNICWEGRVGKKYVADILLNESEILAAFKKLTNGKDDHPMQLHLEITDDPRVIHTSLSDGKYIIKMNKTEVSTFRRR